MTKDIRVLIVEDDPYARDLMALLLTRDWRTQVVGEVGTQEDVGPFLTEPEHRVDLILLDTEKPKDPDWPFSIAEFVRGVPEPPTMLFTATTPNLQVIRRLLREGLGSYILKGDILYALASAVAQAAAGRLVITPRVRDAAPRRTFPYGTLVLDGRRPATGLTERERELVRLGIIFNLSIRDIADELVISSGWVSEIMSTVYKKLGMREILAGETPLESYFHNPAVVGRYGKILKRYPGRAESGKIRKAPWMATLAFHILTRPDRDEI
jgi:DNA-binding NarL/FixJ family response regulator